VKKLRKHFVCESATWQKAAWCQQPHPVALAGAAGPKEPPDVGWGADLPEATISLRRAFGSLGVC